MIGARPLEDDEVNEMLKAGFTGRWRRRDKALFALGISCGFRRQEILGLRMRDVMKRKYPKDYITARRITTKGQSQGYTNRLQPFARQALQPWLDERRHMAADEYGEENISELQDEPFLISRKSKQRKVRTFENSPLANSALTGHQVNHILDQAYERCGITGPVSTHSMRKTFAKKKYIDAVRKFRNGDIQMEPLRVVQKALGHKSIQATLSYLSFIGSDTDPELFDFDPYL